MNPIIRIKQEAFKVRLLTENFQELVNEFMTNDSIKSIDKVELHEWLEQEGLGDYI